MNAKVQFTFVSGFVPFFVLMCKGGSDNCVFSGRELPTCEVTLFNPLVLCLRFSSAYQVHLYTEISQFFVLKMFRVEMVV